MGSKKFSEIRGVVLHKIGEDENRLRLYISDTKDKDKYEIVSRGDTIFTININSLTIERHTVKMAIKRGNMIDLYHCKPNESRDCIPAYYICPPHCSRDTVTHNKSSYGLVFTNIEDAIKKLEKIKEGRYFGALKKGDIIYMVDKAHNRIINLTVEGISRNNIWYSDGKHFNITTSLGDISCYNSEYEENVSLYSDSSFNICLWCSRQISIHMDKSVAEKVLKEYNDIRQNMQKKKAEKPTIPLGTPIRHKDNKNKELHYGDIVSYVRRNGLHGQTDISFGVVIGDTEQKIKILDKEEAKIGKKIVSRRSTNQERFKKSSGMHILDKVNVIRIKEYTK